MTIKEVWKVFHHFNILLSEGIPNNKECELKRIY